MPMAAAKEDDIDERLNNCYKSLLDQKNHKLWQNIDAWIDKMQKEPAERRDREGLFEATRNSMICQIEFISLVLKHIGASRTGEMLTNSPHTEYIHFLHVANSTQFVKESEKLPQSNIFALLSELFSEIPEFSQEAGPLLDGLKQHLTLLLPSADMGWQKLTFNPRLFHKVYFSLCLVFNVTDNEDDSSSTSSDTSDGPERKDRPQIMFASFIAAILVAIWNEHELSIGSKLKDYKRIHRAEDLLTTIVLSPYFRSLSFFFLVGFWLIVKYRREGGYITHNRHRPYPVRRAEEDAEEFKKKIANVPAFKTGFDFEVDKKDIEESLQKEWQIFSIELLRRGLLKIPDGFRIDLGNSPNSGEPLKVSKRKLLPIPENYLSPQKVAKVRVEKASPTKKKDQRKSSKLQKPAPSNAAPLPPDPPTPPPRIIHPADVGLCPPMYVQQYSVVRDFHEEVKRRKTDGSSMDDFRRVEERLFGKYAELESIRNIIAGMPKMKLTQDQKSVQAHFKKTWRQMEPEPLTEDVVESPEKPEKPDMPIKKKAPVKATRKWKRRY